MTGRGREASPTDTISFRDNAAFGHAGAVAAEGRQYLEPRGALRSDPFATVAGGNRQRAFAIGTFSIGGQSTFGGVANDR